VTGTLIPYTSPDRLRAKRSVSWLTRSNLPQTARFVGRAENQLHAPPHLQCHLFHLATLALSYIHVHHLSREVPNTVLAANARRATANRRGLVLLPAGNIKRTMLPFLPGLSRLAAPPLHHPSGRRHHPPCRAAWQQNTRAPRGWPLLCHGLQAWNGHCVLRCCGRRPLRR